MVAVQHRHRYGRQIAEGRGLRPDPRLRTLLIDVGDRYRSAVTDPRTVPDTVRGGLGSVYCAGQDPVTQAVAQALPWARSCQQSADGAIREATDPRNAGVIGIVADAAWAGMGWRAAWQQGMRGL